MKSLWNKSVVVASATVWSMAAFAASSKTTVPASAVPAAKSTAQAEMAAPAKAEFPIGVSTLSYVYGPFVNDPGNSAITDDAIDSVAGISTRHMISFKYKLSKEMTIAPVLDFDYQLTDPTSGGLKEREFRWRDSYLKLSRSGLLEKSFNGNDFALDGDLRLFVPSSLGARTNDTIGAVRLSLNPSLQIGKSPFSISMANFAKFWIQSKDATATGGGLPRLQLYTGPQVNYALSEKATAFVLYETNMVLDTKGINNMNDPMASLTDLEPGVELQLHKRLSLTPYLNWYTNQKVSTTTINLAASVTLL